MTSILIYCAITNYQTALTFGKQAAAHCKYCHTYHVSHLHWIALFGAHCSLNHTLCNSSMGSFERAAAPRLQCTMICFDISVAISHCCNAFSRVHCIAAAGKCDICVSVSRVLLQLHCNEVWCTGAQWCWNCIVIDRRIFSTGANAQWLAFINLLRRKFVNLSRPGRLITKENTRFKTLIIF